MAQLLPYLRMLQRGWWIIALAALASFNLALFNDYNTTPAYRARAQFLVSPSPMVLAGASDDLVRSIEALDKRSIVSTYAEILGSATIYEETIEGLQLDKAQLLGYERSAVVLPDASVLELTIEGSDPEMVALLANQVGERAIQKIRGLYLVYDTNFLNPATPPSDAFSPQPFRNAAIALVLGAVVGIFLVLGRELLTSPLTFMNQRLHTDQTSGAYTRRYMNQKLEAMLGQDEMGALSLLRISNLPELKEQLPHPIWQDLSQYVTGLIRKEIRGKDVVGHWDTTTFALLFPESIEETTVQLLASIKKRLDNPVNLPSYANPIQLNSRIGVATTETGAGREAIIQAAEQDLAQRVTNKLTSRAINPSFPRNGDDG